MNIHVNTLLCNQKKTISCQTGHENFRVKFSLFAENYNKCSV